MAKNQVQERGAIIPLTFATVSPTAGDPICKTSAKATGGITGVALNGTATVGEVISVATEGVFSLPVTAGGAIAVGSVIFASIPATVETCTTVLSETNTGIPIGWALEAITGAGAATIKIKLGFCSHL